MLFTLLSLAEAVQVLLLRPVRGGSLPLFVRKECTALGAAGTIFALLDGAKVIINYC